MPLTSDLTLDASKFKPEAISQQTDEFNKKLIKIMEGGPRWYELPPAIFTCGTLDCLLDDTVMMSAKWAMSGAETVVKIYPGAPHGFIFFPPGGTETTEEGLKDVRVFITEKL
ncbi:hypothetical protein LTR28_007210 [Elasticomyces elasticus]|nr:hypothetical protein LTR28_007210 [Elasticomyces elasticus]